MHSLFAVIRGRGGGGERTTPWNGRDSGRERERGEADELVVGQRGSDGEAKWRRINRYRDTASRRKPTSQQLWKGPCWGAARRRLECTENRSQGCRHSEICNGLGNVSHCTVYKIAPTFGRKRDGRGRRKREEEGKKKGNTSPSYLKFARILLSYFFSIFLYYVFEIFILTLRKYSFDSFSRRLRFSRFRVSFEKNCKFITCGLYNWDVRKKLIARFDSEFCNGNILSTVEFDILNLLKFL